MEGRKLFKIVKPIANFMALIFKIIPVSILFILWDINSVFENKVAVFIRYCIIKAKAKSCGDNIYIGKNVTIKYIKNLELGNNVSIHNNCYLDCSGNVSILNEVSIAHNSTILSSTHTWDNSTIAIKYNPPRYLPTKIKSNVWIGCGVRIMGGVIIESNTIVGAASVCTKSLDANAIYVGVPAKKVKSL